MQKKGLGGGHMNYSKRSVLWAYAALHFYENTLNISRTFLGGMGAFDKKAALPGGLS